MTQHDPVVRVRHMLDHAREAAEMCTGRQRRDLDTDRQFELALVRLMEIVGEAAARVPDDFRHRHQAIPWRDIADLRNRLIHGYDNINHDILWKIVADELPPLIRHLQRLVEQDSDTPNGPKH